MAPLNLFVRITPKPEHVDDARKAILGILEDTRMEEGCVQFTLLQDEQVPGEASRNNTQCLYLYEEWKTEDDLQLHHDKPYTRSVFESYQRWLAKPIEITRMSNLCPSCLGR